MICSRPKADIVRQQRNTAEVVPFPKDLTPIWNRPGEFHVLLDENSVRVSTSPATLYGKGPAFCAPPSTQRRALHYSQLQSYGDHPKLPMLIIQAIGFGIGLMGGLWSLLTLLDGFAR